MVYQNNLNSSDAIALSELRFKYNIIKLKKFENYQIIV
jgi:hypothetical protein